MAQARTLIEADVECITCNATGLIRLGDYLENNYAAICTDCKGSGYVHIKHTVFTGLREMPSIEFVQAYVQGFEKPLEFTYQQFLDGEIEEKT